MYRRSAWFVGVASILLAGCSFDAGALGDRLCSTDEDCPSQRCIAGVCELGVAGQDADDPFDSDDDVVDRDGTDTTSDASDVATLPDGGADADGGGDTDPVDPPLCEPGAPGRCEGELIVSCDESGERVVEADCGSAAECGPYGCACSDGACVERVCEVGTSECVGLGQVERCEGDGTTAPVVDDCADGEICAAGLCITSDCEPGSTRCVAGSAVACGDDGQIADVTDCDAIRAYCEGGACVPRICDPGTVACAEDVELSGNAVATCSPRGDEWTLTSACGVNNTCVDGVCRPRVCTPGTATCSTDGRVVQACNATGTERVPEECGVGRFCRSTDATCVAQVCVPGSVRCRNSGQTETCNELGSGYLAAVACGASRVCVEGACIDTLCPPGRAYCQDDDTAAQCSDTGDEILATEDCPFGCEEGVCSESICGDGVVDASRGELCDDGNDDPCDGCHACRPTNALVLDGSLQVTSNARWVPERSSFTFEGWVNVLSENGALFGLGLASDRDSVLMRVTNGVAVFSYRNDSNAIVRAAGRTRITGAGWVHVAGVRFGEREAALFVNGRLETVTRLDTRQRSIDATQGRIWVGTDGQLDRSAANLDEVRLSNTIRYTADFTPAPRHVVDEQTLAYYRFDQLSGGVVPSLTGSRDLTLEGATFVNAGCFGASSTAYVCGDGQVAPWEDCDSTAGTCVGCRTASRCAHGLRYDGAGTETGGCYVVLTGAESWDNAQESCRAWGGHLATVDNAGENTFLRGLIPSANFWIGLNDQGILNEGNYRWVSGLSSSFRNWAPGEPNDGGFWGNEDCVEVLGDGRWNDQSCSSGRVAICERAN